MYTYNRLLCGVGISLHECARLEAAEHIFGFGNLVK